MGKTNINQRLEQIREAKGFGGEGALKAFWREIGKPVAYTTAFRYHVVTPIDSERREPSLGYLSAILKTFDDIDADWLVTGRGEMIRPRPSPIPHIPPDGGIAMSVAHRMALGSLFELEKAILTLRLGWPLDAVLQAYCRDVDGASSKRTDYNKLIKTRFPETMRLARSNAPREQLYAAFYAEAALRYTVDFAQVRKGRKGSRGRKKQA